MATQNCTEKGQLSAEPVLCPGNEENPDFKSLPQDFKILVMAICLNVHGHTLLIPCPLLLTCKMQIDSESLSFFS